MDPEEFDDQDIEQVLKDYNNPEILSVAGDLADDVILSEDEAVAILANYGQVRQFLHKKTLARGYTRTPKPSGGKPFPRRKTGNRSAPPKRWTKTHLMSRTKCARCGKEGHWARSCTNPPDERGKRRMAHISFECSECEPPAVCSAPAPAPSSSTLSVISSGGDEEETGEVGTFVLGWFDSDLRQPLAEETSIFPSTLIGLQVCPGFAVLDTGAQHNVCGKAEYTQLVERLALHGLQPHVLPHDQHHSSRSRWWCWLHPFG